METAGQTIVSLKGAVKDYPSGGGTQRVLKGIDFSVSAGELVVILGPSGSGKSTLMNLLGGMDFLTEGVLTVEGRDFTRPGERELTAYRRDYVGFVFQSYHLMPNLTARENVAFIAEISRHPMDVTEALRKVGVLELADHFPAQLSGGQQQRVSIARAIVKRPALILADEPTAALDCSTGQEVLSVIEEVVKTQGTAVVMVTHNAEIAKMAHRVVLLRDGSVDGVRENAAPVPASEIFW